MRLCNRLVKMYVDPTIPAMQNLVRKICEYEKNSFV